MTIGRCPPAQVVDGFQFYDSTLVVPGASAGLYTLALTAYPNLPVGGSLRDSFTGGGSFAGRLNAFALDVAVQGVST